jgi:hypothetical protein
MKHNDEPVLNRPCFTPAEYRGIGVRNDWRLMNPVCSRTSRLSPGAGHFFGSE